MVQICEEAPVQLESEVPTEPAGTSQRPSNVLVPKLLALFSSPYEDAKCLSVSIMNLLAGGAPSAVADQMDRSAYGSRTCNLQCSLLHSPSPIIERGTHLTASVDFLAKTRAGQKRSIASYQRPIFWAPVLKCLSPVCPAISQACLRLRMTPAAKSGSRFAQAWCSCCTCSRNGWHRICRASSSICSSPLRCLSHTVALNIAGGW